jgi:hypothetical protein
MRIPCGQGPPSASPVTCVGTLLPSSAQNVPGVRRRDGLQIVRAMTGAFAPGVLAHCKTVNGRQDRASVMTIRSLQVPPCGRGSWCSASARATQWKGSIPQSPLRRPPFTSAVLGRGSPCVKSLDGSLRLAGAWRIPTKEGPPCQNGTQLSVSQQEVSFSGVSTTGLASIPRASGSVGSGGHRRRVSPVHFPPRRAWARGTEEVELFLHCLGPLFVLAQRGTVRRIADQQGAGSSCRIRCRKSATCPFLSA